LPKGVYNGNGSLIKSGATEKVSKFIMPLK
jgi:hypothetical protein